MSKVQRESVELSLVRVEEGSSVLIFDSDVQTLLDLPNKVFAEFIREANRNEDHGENISIQRTALNLEPLLAKGSPIEWIEFDDAQGSSGRYDAPKLEKIREHLIASEAAADPDTFVEVVGRLLELDLSRQTFQIHGVRDEPTTIAFADFMEPIVKEALERFVNASVTVSRAGTRELLSIVPIEAIPESQFYEKLIIEQVIAAQGVSPLSNVAGLELPDGDSVPLEEFIEFRRGKAS